ncbi:hypothetical protein [Gorillibacterium sp. CAU 1737]|uniref:hypothetical protein n=1 Tax=Gorillibacterium sp. CAU 1737 TaxID=3140362 RepID=UPI00326050B7
MAPPSLPPEKPSAKQPIPREITYRIGRKTGKIQTPNASSTAQIRSVEDKKSTSASKAAATGVSKGKSPFLTVARFAGKELTLPPSSVLMGLLITTPVVIVAVTVFWLYALIHYS